ncbi:MAG: hypothetical protein C0497_05310 [Gemmatimonas sp.]|nr:hypothetical protein [Gemmatimonas sp.]
MESDAVAQGCPRFGGVGHDDARSPEGLWLGGKPSSIPAVAMQASPVTWVSADDPPFIIQHGGPSFGAAGNLDAIAAFFDRWLR